MKQKLTRWFPGYIKPVRPGVYQQMSGGIMKVLGYQRWDGRVWYGWRTTAEEALTSTAPAIRRHQNDKWRGIRK